MVPKLLAFSADVRNRATAGSTGGLRPKPWSKARPTGSVELRRNGGKEVLSEPRFFEVIQDVYVLSDGRDELVDVLNKDFYKNITTNLSQHVPVMIRKSAPRQMSSGVLIHRLGWIQCGYICLFATFVACDKRTCI